MADQRGGTRAGVETEVQTLACSAAPVERALRKGVITARGADRALRVAWSVADLAGEAMPGPDQVVTALDFRDRGFQ